MGQRERSTREAAGTGLREHVGSNKVASATPAAALSAAPGWGASKRGWHMYRGTPRKAEAGSMAAAAAAAASSQPQAGLASGAFPWSTHQQPSPQQVHAGSQRVAVLTAPMVAAAAAAEGPPDPVHLLAALLQAADTPGGKQAGLTVELASV